MEMVNNVKDTALQALAIVSIIYLEILKEPKILL